MPKVEPSFDVGRYHFQLTQRAFLKRTNTVRPLINADKQGGLLQSDDARRARRDNRSNSRRCFPSEADAVMIAVDGR